MRRAVMMLSLAVFGLALLGCGGGGSEGGGGGTYSCDVGSGGAHACTEYAWSAAYSTATWSMLCTQQGGTAGTACTHTGALGGCKITTSSGSVTLSTTNWYYSGTASSLQSACTRGGTGFSWVSP